MDLIKFFSKSPEFETERLFIRKLLPRDASDMFSYASRPETSKYLLWDPHPSNAYTVDLISFLQKEYTTGRYSDFAIILKSENRMIGTVGFTSYDEKNATAEVGYVINPDYWHRGIGTEALEAILSIAFSELNVQRVETKYMPENVYSRKVMEKCGMTYEGTARRKLLIKGNYRDIAYCSVLREEYFARVGDKRFAKPLKSKNIRRLFDFSYKN